MGPTRRPGDSFVALSPAAPEPKRNAGPVLSAANADRVRPLAEFNKAGVRGFRPGPGRGQRTLLDPRNGPAIIADATFRPLRSFDARLLDVAASKEGGSLAWMERDGHVLIHDF